ncbi:alcohol dehydrogenase [Aspergillus sp. HF37]|nr:alcohol dehydrogenase [Aspergillus sp. HF37]
MSSLPSKYTTDILIARYFSHYDPVTHFLHSPTFQAVIAIDAGDEKKAMCQQLGAESWNQAYVDFTKSKDVVADVKASSPDELGAHAVILLTVAEKPFQQAAEYVRSRVLLSPLACLHMRS